MSFAVEPADLSGYAKLIERASEDFAGAGDYLTKNTEIDFSCSADIWNKVFTDHQEHVSKAKELLKDVRGILASSAKELGNSASYYRQTDRSEANRHDATYPDKAAGSPQTGKPEQPGTFSDVCDANSRLKPVGGDSGWLQGHMDEMEFASANKSVGTLLDFTSPSALVNEGLKLAFDIDIFGTVTNWLAGDWQSYADCADAWGNLGDFCDGVAHNIRNGNAVLAGTWRGNAADAATSYFENLASRLDKAKAAFDSLQALYKEVATAVFGFAEFVKGPLVAICDMALQVAVMAAAAGAVSATGVGAIAGIAGGAVIAARILSMIGKWKSIVAAYEVLGHTLNGTMLIGGGVMSGASQDVKSFPVAGHRYDNELVS